MLRSRTLATALTPSAPGLRLAEITIGTDHIIAALIATRPTTPCPQCGRLARRVHSVYRRTLTDLPWGRYSVRLHLTVRKFFCNAAACPRRIFTERLPGIVAPSARRTTRFDEVLRALAFALGGEAGARLVCRLGMAVSPATLLRLVRRAPLTEGPTPRVVGVDDWAFRKGQHYGTILVDLEQHRVIELLADRRAETVSEWLREHPGVEVVSRDRALAYAEAARAGAPQAVQVADRWHLLQNLVGALERCLLRHGPALKVAAGAEARGAGPLPSYPEAARIPWQRRAEAASRQKHAGKVEQYARIHALAAAGFTKLDIAQIVGVSRPTVYRYLALEAPPERRRPHRPGRRVLEPYEPYLRRRWAEGCRNRSRLFREIRLLGYERGARTVFRFLEQLDRGRPGSAQPPKPTPARVPSARHVAFLLVRRPEDLADDDRAYLDRLCEQTPTIAAAYALSQGFAAMVRGRRGERFAAWLEQVRAGGIAELSGFARGLLDDRAAVEAGLSLAWSNGQTEGQITKLKLLKRSMYGRANFDLLRRRVLEAA